MSAVRVDIERLRQLCAKGLNAVQIAARLGVSKEAVWQACKRHGLTVAAAPRGQTDISFASNVSQHIESCGSRNS